MAIEIKEGVPFKDQWATIYLSINGRDRFITKGEIRGLLGTTLRNAGFDTAAQRMKVVNKKIDFERVLTPSSFGVSQDRITTSGTCKGVQAVGKFWSFVTWNVRTTDHSNATPLVASIADFSKFPSLQNLVNVERNLSATHIFAQKEVSDRPYAKWLPFTVAARPFTRPLPSESTARRFVCGFSRKDVKVPPLPPPVPPRPGVGIGLTGLAMIIASTLIGN